MSDPGSNQLTQNVMILQHLQAGHAITPLDALHLFGSFRLAARIFDLRKRGHLIVTVRQQDLATGKVYARYHLLQTAPGLQLPPQMWHGRHQAPGEID